MTVFNGSGRITNQTAGRADNISRSNLCYTVDRNSIQIQVADFSLCCAKQPKYIRFKRCGLRPNGNLRDGISVTVKITGKDAIIRTSQQCIRKRICNRCPRQPVQVYVGRQNKVLLFVGFSVIHRACKICKLCSVSNLIRILCGTCSTCERCRCAAIPDIYALCILCKRCHWHESQSKAKR